MTDLLQPVEVSEETVAAVLARDELVCAEGWGLSNVHRESREERRAYFERSRAELLTPMVRREIGWCLAWLEEVRPWRTTVDDSCPSSYHLKHVVERWCGEYVCNGAMIVATMLAEVPVKRSFNPVIGIRRRALTS